MKTSKETLKRNLEFCKQNLMNADLSLYINNDDGKGWILPDELRGTSYRINDAIEYIEIIIKNI